MSEDPDPSDLFDFNSSMHETSEEAARAEQAAAQSLQSARILVVDDSKMMRMGITRDLKKLGFTNVADALNELPSSGIPVNPIGDQAGFGSRAARRSDSSGARESGM